MTAFELNSIHPVMGEMPPPMWPGGRWIGALDVSALIDAPERLTLVSPGSYRKARLLLREGMAIRGFVEVGIADGTIASADVRTALVGLPAPTPINDAPMPAITVAVTTRNRPKNIPSLAASLQRLDYPEFEILIVDNASATSATMDAIAALGDPRVRGIREPLPGASRGRNAALLAARHDIVAFVDDDVVVDPLWLRGVAQGFARATNVGIVTGMVPSGELCSPAQGYFESHIAWEIAGRAQVFSLARPPSDVPLFPFEVGLFGTGANFAVRRGAAIAIGGMNEALGTGSPAGGGEDIDLFVRMLYAGHSLVYEPTSVAWHRHRREIGELDRQLASYGRGFGAWITSVLMNRQTRGDALRLIARAALRVHTVGSTPNTLQRAELPLDLALLRRREVVGMLTGPYWYARARLDRRIARPLSPR